MFQQINQPNADMSGILQLGCDCDWGTASKQSRVKPAGIFQLVCCNDEPLLLKNG